MRIAIVGDGIAEARKLLAAHGDFFTVIESGSPDMVVSFGGDGTLMKAEHAYPGVPKLYLKNSRIAKLGHQKKENREILEHVVRGEYTIEETMKLEARTHEQKVLGLNDIVIHNENPRYGIRYVVEIDGEPFRDGVEIIGDGVVFATPLGSTGYYRSITDSLFEVGIGMAFNNSTEQSDHVVIRENRVVKIKIVRGPAICYADNQDESIVLKENEWVEIRKSSETAKIVRV